jgi:hypothetical protein
MAYRTSRSSSKAQREVIRPDVDGIKIRLDKNPDQYTQCERKNGVDYQYICNNNAAIMWIPKSGRDALMQTGARAGDLVEIWQTDEGEYCASLAQDRPRQQQQQQQQPQQVPATVDHRPASKLVNHALRISLEGLAVAKEHAEKLGLDLGEMSWEDARSITNTLLINYAKQGGK